MNERIPTPSTDELDAMVGGPVYDVAPDKGHSKMRLSGRRIAAYGLAAGAVLGGGLMGWSQYQAVEADRALAERRIELEEMRVRAQAEASRSVVTEADKAREKAVMDCVDKGKTEAGFGSSTADVIERCSQAFPSSVAVNDLGNVASGDGGSVSLGGGTVLFVIAGAAAVYGIGKVRGKFAA